MNGVNIKGFYLYYQKHGTALHKLEIIIYVLHIIGFYIWSIWYLSSYFDGFNKKSIRFQKGWVYDRYRDKTDTHYSLFINTITDLSTGAFIFLIVDTIIYITTKTTQIYPILRYLLHTISGTYLLIRTSGSGAILAFILFIINYLIIRYLNTNSITPYFTWVFSGIVMVFLGNNEYLIGTLLDQFRWLDDYYGKFVWWTVPWLVLSRIVSFNFDYYWLMLNQKGSLPVLSKESTGSDPYHPFNYSQRFSCLSEIYGLLAYMGYQLYPPTLLYGPIFTFNSYLSHIKNYQKNYTLLDLFLYMIRWMVVLLIKEILDHYFYIMAYVESIFYFKDWEGVSVTCLAVLIYWTYTIIYLKFYIIWRYFRFIALLDGIEVPENLIHSIFTNYTISDFWKCWYRSFHLWLVRYIYIPLGGKQVTLSRRIMNVFLIFSFVAFCLSPNIQDLHALIWAITMASFISIELLIHHYIFSIPFIASLKNHFIWRYLLGLAGTVNILMLIFGNMLGYGITHSQLGNHWMCLISLMDYIFRREHWFEVMMIFYFLFIGTQLMIILRKIEEYSNT